MRDQLEALYRNKRSAMVKSIIRKAGTIENAEDIVQDAFTAALTYAHTFNPEHDLETWMNTILGNALKRFKRGERNHIEIDEGNGGWTEAELVYAYKHSDEMLHHINRKPREERDILYGYLISGLKYRALAELYGVTFKHIDYLLYQFRKEMRVT